MKELFEISWVGGAAERRFRAVRPVTRALPWGTLDTSRYAPRLLERARAMWTQMAYTEYATAAAFSSLVGAMLAAKAPLDLVAIAADFVVDETCHAELACRVVAELGGAVPLRVDYDTLGGAAAGDDLSPLQRANQKALELACVGEAFSAHMAVGVQRAVSHPLTRAVYDVIARDEAHHGRFGELYMRWATTECDEAELERLAGVAVEALRGMRGFWTRAPSRAPAGVTADGSPIAHVHELGWMQTDAYVARAERAVRSAVVAPLARVGIRLDARAVDALFSAPSGAACNG